MYRNVSLKMDKIFPKYYITYFGLCKFFNNRYLFSYDAVLWDTLYNYYTIDAKLSTDTLISADTKQMWVMEEGVLKCATKDFTVAISSQDVWSDVTLSKSLDNPDDGKWIIKSWGS